MNTVEKQQWLRCLCVYRTIYSLLITSNNTNGIYSGFLFE